MNVSVERLIKVLLQRTSRCHLQHIKAKLELNPLPINSLVSNILGKLSSREILKVW